MSTSRLLKLLGYSLQSNQRKIEGTSHLDRGAQLKYFNEKLTKRLNAGEPIILVDTKKKELIDPYKTSGKERSPKGSPVAVNTHDWESLQWKPFADGGRVLRLLKPF